MSSLHLASQCQANDWPCHKQLCGRKNTTNIDSKNLLQITNILLHNHTTTVEKRTGRPLSESQKEIAKVSLVKQLKDWFTGDFKQYNSPRGSIGAPSDPAFNAALADFFAKQPGYEEVWGVLRVGYKEKFEEQQKIQQCSGEVNIDDESIRELCTRLANMLVFQFGSLMAGGTSDMLDGTRRDNLLNDMVALVKKFALEQPEYNSHRGLMDMPNNDEFKSRMIDTISAAMEIEVE